MTTLTVLTLLFLALTGYVYVGYPVLLAAIASVTNRPVGKAEHCPSISLIIAAYDEEAVIAAKVANSLDLDYPADRLQILVVCDGSTDGTAERARSAGGVRVEVLHEAQRKGKAAAINRAVGHADGEILVFSDANAIYRREALRHLARNFADHSVGCVSGDKCVVSGQSEAMATECAYWRYESVIRRLETATGSCVSAVGEIIAVRKDLFEAIAPGIINDDSYIAWRTLSQGHRVVYEPRAVATEVGAASTADERVRRRRIVSGRFQQLFRPGLWLSAGGFNVFKIVSHKLLRLGLPFFMLAAIICNLAGIAADGQAWLLQAILAGQIAIYGLALVGWIGERVGVRLRLAQVLYYVVASNAAGLEGALDYFLGKQSALWPKAHRGNEIAWVELDHRRAAGAELDRSTGIASGVSRSRENSV